MSIRLHADAGGQGSPTLVLLHGLGANASVWDGMRPLIKAHWPGRFIAPDLRGHGRSPHAEPYGYATLAADVADLLRQDEEIALLGHSMGGAVAMALATGWFGVRVRCMLALGVKLVWTAKDIARANALGQTPVRWFDSREQAIERYLRVAGLVGLVAPTSAVAALGIAEEGEKFRLAADPRVNCVAASPIEDLVRAVRAPVRLAAGENDPMVTRDHLLRCDPDACLLTGLGHNAHVEAPARVWRLFEELVRATGCP